jgi:hypothetical protein
MKLKYMTMSIICASLLMVSLNASEDNDIVNSENVVTQGLKSVTDVKPARVNNISKVEYKVNMELLDVVSDVPIYAVNIVDIKNLDIDGKIATAFNFDTIKQDTKADKNGVLSTMTMDGEGRMIQYFDSGATLYTNGNPLPLQSKDILKNNGLDKQSAKVFYKKMAIDFLRKNDLLKDNIEFKNVSYASVQKMNQKDIQKLKRGVNSNKNKRVIGTAVHFNYKIGDIPTWGAGSEMVIYFDEFGVSSYFDQMRNFSISNKVNNSRTISQTEAVKRYTSNKQPKNLLKTEPITVKKVNIENVTLVYYIEAVNKMQKEIKPHYLIKGTFSGKDLNGKEKQVEFEWLESAQN